MMLTPLPAVPYGLPVQLTAPMGAPPPLPDAPPCYRPGPASVRSDTSTASTRTGPGPVAMQWMAVPAAPTAPVFAATVVLNGVQVIRCALPTAAHTAMATEVADPALLPCAEGEGVAVDALFMVPHAAAKAYEWAGTLTITYVAYDDTTLCVTRELGAVAKAGGCCHIGLHVEGQPVSAQLSVAHRVQSAGGLSPVEKRLIEEVIGILRNPRLNGENGSLSSVLINNKAKESVLYDEVVGKGYNKSWSEFLRAHSATFKVFYYSDVQVKELELAPHIKRSDARVHLAAYTAEDVWAADKCRCAALRAGEEELRDFLLEVLQDGELSQRDLLGRLKQCRGFNDSLFPTSSLLLRFLQSHRGVFKTPSEPDQPTRIALVRPPAAAAALAATRVSTPTSSRSLSDSDDGTPLTPCTKSQSSVSTATLGCREQVSSLGGVYRHDPYHVDPYVFHVTA